MSSTIITRPSVRTFSLLTLIIIALMSVSIILYATFNMHQGALKAQFTSMERVVEVAVNEQMRQMNRDAVSLGHTISQRQSVKTAYKNYLETGSHLSLQKQLKDPLLNGHKFSASLELIWLRSYDLKLKLVTESLDVSATPLPQLPENISDYLVQRQGMKRMQTYSALWQDSMSNPYYSVFLPIGGLRPQGYLEVVINPLFNLPHIENMIQMPVVINLQGGIISFKPKQALDEEHFMPISYWLKDADKKPVINITAYADIAQFESQTNRTIWQSVIVLLMLTGSVLVLVMWLLNHYLFRPLNNMVSRLDDYETDSSVTISNEGLLELHILSKAFNRLLIRLNERNEELKQLSMLDGLTGIANRRRFDNYLHQEWQRAKKTKQAISLLLIDIDHFKLYNDHYGHQQGDFCLRQVAKIIEESLEYDDDLVARYGGEEFTVVLPHTKKSDAKKVAERIMHELHQRQLKHGKSPTNPCITISIGISGCSPSHADIDESCLVSCTDQALYQAKELGRNRYFVMGELREVTIASIS